MTWRRPCSERGPADLRWSVALVPARIRDGFAELAQSAARCDVLLVIAAMGVESVPVANEEVLVGRCEEAYGRTLRHRLAVDALLAAWDPSWRTLAAASTDAGPADAGDLES